MYSAYVLEIGSRWQRLLVTATDPDQLRAALDPEDLRVYVGAALSEEQRARDLDGEAEGGWFRVWILQSGAVAGCLDLRGAVSVGEEGSRVPLLEAGADGVELGQSSPEVDVAWEALAALPSLVEPVLEEGTELFPDPGDLDVALPRLTLGRTALDEP